MGNSSSSSARRSPYFGEGSDEGDGFRPRRSTPASTTPPMNGSPSINPDKLRHSLREKGLVVAESDIMDVLSNQTTLVNALAFLMDSGKAKRSVNSERVSSAGASRVYQQLRFEHPSSSLGSTTTTSIVQKRARQDESNVQGMDEMDTGGVVVQSDLDGRTGTGDERPQKRLTRIVLGSSGLGPENMSGGSENAMSVEKPSAPSVQPRGPDQELTEPRVVAPVQPKATQPPALPSQEDKPATAQCSTEAPAIMPEAKPEAPAPRTFGSPPQELNMRELNATLLSVLEAWPKIDPGDRAEAIKKIEGTLCLPELGTECKHRLNKRLSKCLEEALVDLTSLSASREKGVKLLIGSVTKVRHCIHSDSLGVIKLYNHHFPPSRIASADELGRVARCAGDTPFDRLAPLEASGGTPKSTWDTPNFGTRVEVTPPKLPFVFGIVAKEFRGQAGDVVGRSAVNAGYTMDATSSAAGSYHCRSSLTSTPYMAHSLGMNGGCKESPMHPGSSLFVAHQSIPRTNASVQVLAANSSPTSPPSTPIPNPNGDPNPNAAAIPSGGATKFVQDDAFWAWMRVCQTALERSMEARKEREWLKERVSEIADRMKNYIAVEQKAVREFDDGVRKLDEDIQRAADKTESLTQKVIKRYLDAEATKEASLRALLVSIQQGGDAGQHSDLCERKLSSKEHEELVSRRELQRAEMGIRNHALEVNKALLEELYGDFMEVMESRAKDADHRQTCHQADLKLASKETLKMMQDAIAFHLKRKSRAEEIMEGGLARQKEHEYLFGKSQVASSLKAQAEINEMRSFARQSETKIQDIKKAARSLHSSLKGELPADDVQVLVESTRQFFKSNDDLAAAQMGGSKPLGDGAEVSGFPSSLALDAKDDFFPMNMLSDDAMTWAVERERGMSFDLSALYDADGPTDPAADMKRVEIESESSFNDFPLGQSLSQGSRQAALSNPVMATPHPLPSKRHLPGSFESRSMNSVKRQLAGPLQSPTRDPPVSSRAQTRSQVARTIAAPSGPTTVTNKTRTSMSRGRGECGGSSSRRRSPDVDTVALAAQLGLVDGRNQCGRRGGKGAGVYRVGSYTLEERAELVAKFHAKRGRRIWRKKIKYDCRKKLADKRPRLKGRFVTQEELNGLDAETLAKVTGLGPYEDSSSDVEAEDSDSSESYVAPTLTRVRNPSKAGKPGGCAGSTVVHSDQARPPSESSGRPSSASPPTRPGLRSKNSHAGCGTRVSRHHFPLRSKGVSMVDDFSIGEAGEEAKTEAQAQHNPGMVTSGAGRGTVKPPPSHNDSPKGSSGSEVSVRALSVQATGAPADAHCNRNSSNNNNNVNGRSRADSMGALGGFDVMEMFAPIESCGNGVSPIDSETQDCGPGAPDLKVETEDVKIDLYDHSDLVSGFMVDDILSNNFSVVSHHDIISPGVTVN